MLINTSEVFKLEHIQVIGIKATTSSDIRY